MYISKTLSHPRSSSELYISIQVPRIRSRNFCFISTRLSASVGLLLWPTMSSTAEAKSLDECAKSPDMDTKSAGSQLQEFEEGRTEILGPEEEKRLVRKIDRK